MQCNEVISFIFNMCVSDDEDSVRQSSLHYSVNNRDTRVMEYLIKVGWLDFVDRFRFAHDNNNIDNIILSLNIL